MREPDYPPLLTLAEERSLLAELVERRANGRGGRYLEARERIALANLRLVRALARRYARNRAELEDLVQVGVVGLLGAIDRYDPARANGGRFATHAGWWIRSALSKARPSARELPDWILDTLPAREAPPEVAEALDVGAVLSLVTPRQRHVLTLCYGLDGHPPRPIAEVAAGIGITHQGAGKIRRQAVAKIRKALHRTPLPRRTHGGP